MRLQKYLSRAGVASRRASERLMLDGRVRVNGERATELGTQVDPERDRVEVDGQVVRLAAPEWVALNKPSRVISTRDDPQGRRTVYDLLPAEFDSLFYVGRLDYDSEGLLLLTNQGNVAHRMMHPSYEVDREYEVHTTEPLSREAERQLKQGVELEDGPAALVGLSRLKEHPRTGRARVQAVLQEGRNREVRRMFEAVGHPVERLVRVRYGPIRLGELERGAWRRLDRSEREALERIGKRGGGARGNRRS